MSICDIKQTLGSWDWTNQTLMSSWLRRDNGRYPAKRNPPGLYTTSGSATVMLRLYYGNWCIKASGDIFSVTATKNIHIFFSNKATLLKRSSCPKNL